jgi:CRISPR system Cascade subunit CasC
VKQGGDDEGDAGAAMLGDIEFNAATFYRYANVDANRLNDTLGSTEATAKAVQAFVQAFITSMPKGKINTFAHATLPELVYVTIRDTQAVNLIGAFERSVKPDFVENATQALVRREQEFEKAYDVAPVKSWVVRIGDDTAAADALVEGTSSLSELVEGVGAAVSTGLAQE